MAGFDYIDVHSHLYFPDFDVDREEEIEKIRDAGIGVITIGVDFDSSEKAVDLAEKHDNFYACVGMHPDDVTEGEDFDERITAIISHPKTVAIGECGLDYFRIPNDANTLKSAQKKIFERQISLSLEAGKPLMLHIRPSDKISFDAYKDSLHILESYAAEYGEKLRGAAHFFVGDLDILKRFLSIGFSVTFGGVLTFSRDYDECVRYAPLENILSETDAPFVAPAPYRGKRNSPLYVPEVVKAVAAIRAEPLEKVAPILRNNAVRLFRLA